jgi:hypothetical protein
MMRSWAQGLLAILFTVTLVQGSLFPRGALQSFASSLLTVPLFSLSPEEKQSSPRFSDKGIEPSSSRNYGSAKRDREVDGDDPSLLPTLLVVAIALFYALPLRGSDVVRALRIGLTPEGRHREAGRCPTGPPGLPC